MLMQRGAPVPTVAKFDATPAQLALPWRRDPGRRGISPHGLSVSRNPIKFFFQYCAPYSMRPTGFQQTEPMAVGSACDGLLKQALVKNEWQKNRRKHYRAPVNARTFSLWGTVAPHNRTKRVRERAYQVHMAMMASPLWDYLKTFEVHDLETDKKDALWVHGVPLNGKLDFLFGSPNEPRNIVADLKVNGAFSKTGSTPVPGYAVRWDWDIQSKTGKMCPPHPKAGIPLEELNWGFAVQLATYAIMEASREQGTPTPELNAPTRTMLIQATFKKPTKEPKTRADGTKRDWNGRDGGIVITIIDSYISPAFQRETLARYRALWNSIQAKTLVPHKFASWGLDVMQTFVARDHLDDLT